MAALPAPRPDKLPVRCASRQLERRERRSFAHHRIRARRRARRIGESSSHQREHIREWRAGAPTESRGFRSLLVLRRLPSAVAERARPPLGSRSWRNRDGLRPWSLRGVRAEYGNRTRDAREPRHVVTGCRFRSRAAIACRGSPQSEGRGTAPADAAPLRSSDVSNQRREVRTGGGCRVTMATSGAGG